MFLSTFKYLFYALLWIWELYENFGPPLIMKISVVNSLTFSLTPPPCWENLIDYHVQIRRASLTPFSVFGFPWKLLTASVQFTPYGLISVLQTASFFFNLSEKGTFTDISLSIINICLHIQTDKKIIDVFHIRTFLWLVVDSQLSLSKALPLSWR